MTRRWFPSDIRFSNCLIKWLKSRYQEPAVGQRNSHLLITIFNSIYQLLNVFVRQSWIHELLTKSFESLEEPLQKRVAESGSSKIIKGLFDPLQFCLSVQNWMKFKIARHSEKAAGRLGHSEKEWRGERGIMSPWYYHDDSECYQWTIGFDKLALVSQYRISIWSGHHNSNWKKSFEKTH